MDSSRSKASRIFTKPLLISAIFSLLLLLRNAWLYWSYSYAYYPDSDLYVHSGASFFSTWYIAPVAMFPYPLLNAVTRSAASPALLIWVQMILSAAVGGGLVYLIARKKPILAWVTGLLLLVDLVWAAYARAILTDVMFADMHLLGIAMLLWHYARKFKIPQWETILAGLVYGLIVSIRPSNIFLAVLIPPGYWWLTRSWKKTLSITLGISICFLIVGLINLKGTQKFYILAPSGGHGSDFIAFPLFVNRLFSPENGPASRAIDQYLQTCYPGMNYAQAVDRSEGMAVDSVNNMKFIMGQVLPCIETQKAVHQDNRNLFPGAYFEALIKHPARFAQVVVRETALFLRYGNAYVINWLFNPAGNYGCTNLSWCDQITNSRFALSSSSPAAQIYEKVSVKILQVYLAPMGLLNKIFHGDQTVSVMFSWVLITVLMILFTRGSERLLFIAVTVVILSLYGRFCRGWVWVHRTVSFHALTNPDSLFCFDMVCAWAVGCMGLE